MAIIYDKTRRCFISTTTKLRLSGLHNYLSKKFYPVGSNYSTVKQLKFKSKKKQAKRPQGRERGSGGGLGKLMSGKIAQYRTASGMGNFIDSQFKSIVEKAIKAQPTSISDREHVFRVWTQAPNQTILVPSGLKIPKAPNLKYHNFVKPGFRKLLQADLIPMQCQVVVGSEEKMVATMLDLMAWNKKKKQVAVVENKSGYSGTWDVKTGAGALLAPLQEFADTPHIKAHLQALWGAMLAKLTFGYKYLPEAYVLHADSSGVKLERTPEAMLKHVKALWAK
jgi:hypothetical protein